MAATVQANLPGLVANDGAKMVTEQGGPSPTAVKLSRARQDAEETGVLEDGTRFAIPATFSVMAHMFLPRHWSRGSAALWLLVIFNCAPSLVGGFPLWSFIVLTVFWRLMYNVGLGAVLQHQSQTQFLTKLVRDEISGTVAPSTATWSQRLVHFLIYRQLKVCPWSGGGQGV